MPDKQHQVVQMLRDILRCVDDEPDTGPWYALRHSDNVFGIFEKFSGVAGRQAHVDGGGGDIFRDVERMNSLLASAARVYKLDVLLSKQIFAD